MTKCTSTRAWNLDAQHIIHSYAPVYGDYKLGYTYHIDLLSDTLKEIIVTADAKLGCYSMAIPALSLDIFGFPKLCATTFLDVIEEYAVRLKDVNDYDLKVIRIVNKDPKTNDLF